MTKKPTRIPRFKTQDAYDMVTAHVAKIWATIGILNGGVNFCGGFSRGMDKTHKNTFLPIKGCETL